MLLRTIGRTLLVQVNLVIKRLAHVADGTDTAVVLATLSGQLNE
jgi:hypothetical protein